MVGIGPGGGKSLSIEAKQILLNSEVIIGYKTYIQLIEDLITEQQVISSSMKQELDRCQEALKLAKEGKQVAIVSSGDPGVYGMAGVVLELNEDPDLPVEIVPGTTAATGAASSLGAPLMHDFTVISLSDLLTPWQQIIKKLKAVASTDFVVVLYNPKSSQRREQIEIAREIFLEYRSPQTPVGLVSNNYRQGEKTVITTLEEFTNCDIDMSTTVVIGNDQSYVKFEKMITPRGYQL
ncbi:precorrin-3B C(17)-methyltransferase [Natranaerobius thermophilus JW/NM-WN-LF]